MNRVDLSTTPHQNLVEELELMLRARYPLLYIVGSEEAPIDEVIQQLASQFQPARQVRWWDVVRGWSDNNSDKGSIMGALARVAKANAQDTDIFVLRDLHPIFKNPHSDKNFPVVRELRNLVTELKQSRKILILTSPVLALPDELQEEATVIDFPLPNAAEINDLMTKLVSTQQFKLQGTGKEELVRACQGLSRARIRRVLAKSLASKQQIDETTIQGVLQEKKQAIRQTGILEFYSGGESLQSVGGLENLKLWVRTRQKSFTDKAQQYGLPTPKGLLLVGIQGTGKSLSAKTIAHEWRLPLLRLDAGRLFGGIVGESESRVRQLIQIAEAVSPCVLWIDEIDKAFGNISSGSDGDSGTSRRVFGSLITWMQEKTAAVFIVATANNVEILPAELLRRGRFDEIFFLNLPTEMERREIFRVHLQRLRPSRFREFDLGELGARTAEFSGAEIEQTVIDGMHRAFARSEDFNTEDLLAAVSDTVPLAAIARPQIERLKRWAAEAGARAASEDSQLLEELRQFSVNRGVGPLEVD